MGGGIGLRSAYWESSESQGQGVALLGALRMDNRAGIAVGALADKPRGGPNPRPQSLRSR